MPRVLTLTNQAYAWRCYGTLVPCARGRMNKAEIRKLIKKLNDAAVCCHECGSKWGVYSVGCSSTWNGTCRVCDQETRITESRDYGYFFTGIRKLKLQLKDSTVEPS
jgi:hypothetical protein